MNRKEEYELLMQEIEVTPVRLEYAIQRTEAKVKANRWQRFFGIPIGTGLTFLLVFTILVNSIPTFAYSCGNIPLIKELAKTVAFSPSLDAAIENKYVQPINQEKVINHMKARIEYLIVDQKQVNVFYSLESKDYGEVNIEPEIDDRNGDTLEGYTLASSSYGMPDGKINYITIDFVDGEVPEGLTLKIGVYDMKPSYDLPISTFTFKLIFDPHYTAQGEKLTIGQSIIIDQQKLTLEEVEIYPTHMRIILEDEKENAAYLKSMTFYLENEKGERFDKIANGISATGKIDSPMMNVYRVESAFFSESKELTLYITEAEWLDKDKQRMKLDLANTSAESLPEGVTFESAERRGKSWYLTFSGNQYEENKNYQIWNGIYYDEQGKEYEYNGWSTVSGIWSEKEKKYISKPNTFFVEILLEDYPYDTVYMTPIFSHYIQLENPVAIKIK